MLKLSAVALGFAVIVTSAYALPEATAPLPRAAPAPASGPSAQATANAMNDMVAYVDRYNAINSRLAEGMQTLPEIPAGGGKDDREVRAFIVSARAWSRDMLALTAQLRAEIETMPPPPPGIPDFVVRSTARIRADLPGDLDVQDQFANRYAAMADAIERGDPDAAQQTQLASIDAIGLTLRRNRESLIGQAAILPAETPQGDLMRSYAHSYDGGLAQMMYVRAVIAHETPDRAALAQAIADATANMRADIASGRAATDALRARLMAPGAVAPSERLIAPRVLSAINTYPAAFNREETVAAELDAAAGLLRSDRSPTDIENEWQAHVNRFGDLDFERVADGQQRVALLQGQ